MTIVDGVRLVSNSEVTTFQDCPRRWWLAWFRGLTPLASDEAGALAIGTRIHAALASYYVPEGERPANPMETLQELQGDAYLTWSGPEDRIPLDVVLERQDDLRRLESVFDLEKAMISGYLEWLAESGADANLEVVASERYVEVRLDHTDLRGAVKLIGKLDALIRSIITGELRFIDHKTVGTFLIPNLRQNSQMLHYELIQWLSTGEITAQGAIFNMLRKVKRTAKAKPPFFQRASVPHNRFELEAHLQRVIYVVQQIELAEEGLDVGLNHHVVVPARPSSDCHWKCPFFKICPMFDDGSRVEAAIEDQYQVRDPLHYYGGKEKVSD